MWRLITDMFKHLSSAFELAKLVLVDMGYLIAVFDNISIRKLRNFTDDEDTYLAELDQE